jgi:hypothetical protein
MIKRCLNIPRFSPWLIPQAKVAAFIPVIQLEEFTVKAWTKGASTERSETGLALIQVHLLLSSKLTGNLVQW